MTYEVGDIVKCDEPDGSLTVVLVERLSVNQQGFQVMVVKTDFPVLCPKGLKFPLSNYSLDVFGQPGAAFSVEEIAGIYRSGITLCDRADELEKENAHLLHLVDQLATFCRMSGYCNSNQIRKLMGLAELDLKQAIPL